VVQPDGKILLGGRFTTVAGQPRNRIARLNTNGSLEDIATFDPGLGADGAIGTIALQADGKFLVGNQFTSVDGQPRNRIARLHANGSIESIATFDIGTGASSFVFSAALQANGKVVLGGFLTTFNGQPRNLIVRLANDPATQSLTVPSANRVQWLRGGSSPETTSVAFALSTDGGSVWNPLGAGTRINGGWELTGLSLPPTGRVRARALLTGGLNNGSSGLAEEVAVLALPDTQTQAPILASPADNTVTSTPVVVSFNLPEAALPDSVKLTFSGVVTRQLTLAPSQESVGAHTFSFQPANPTAAPEVTAGVPIPDGVYTVELSYQDGLGNPVATDTSSNVVIDTAAPSIEGVFSPLVVVAGTLPDYTAQALTMDATAVLVTQSPLAGSATAVGTLTVTLTATDAAGNQAGTSFDVIVVASPAPEPVVQTGDEVPNEPPGTTFIEFGTPAIDQGRVGGTATIRFAGANPQRIIYGGVDGSVLARTGGLAPSGETFLSLGDPVFGDLAFGFAAKTRAPASTRVLNGLWSNRSAMPMIAQLAVQGGLAPGVKGGTFAKFTGFGLPRNRAGLLYMAKLKRGGGVSKANDFGLWRERPGGGTDLLLRTGGALEPVGGGSRRLRRILLMTAVPHAPDQRRSFAPDGFVAASTTFDDGNAAVVRVAPDGSLDVPVETTSPVPTLTGAKWAGFGAPATASRGRFAFLGKLTPGAGSVTKRDNEAIFASLNGNLEPILRRGATLPNLGGARLNKLGEPLLGESGLIGLLIALNGPGINARNRDAIVIRQSGEPKIVARLGDPAKDTGEDVVYARFLSIVVTDAPNARLVFTAILSGRGVTKSNRQGIWSVTPEGNVRLLLRLGARVPVGTEMPTVTLLDALQGKPANRGQGRSTDASGFVTARVKLSNGRSGVLRIPVP
jgi:hypothetical protein